MKTLVRWLAVASLGYLGGYFIAQATNDVFLVVILFFVLFVGLNKFDKDLKTMLEEQKEK